MTSSLLAVVELNPRALIAQVWESTLATCKLEARRSASGMLVAPERRMSSCVIIWMADAASESFSDLLETDVTSMSKSSSMLSFFRTLGDWAGSWSWADDAALDMV